MKNNKTLERKRRMLKEKAKKRRERKVILRNSFVVVGIVAWMGFLNVIQPLPELAKMPEDFEEIKQVEMGVNNIPHTVCRDGNDMMVLFNINTGEIMPLCDEDGKQMTYEDYKFFGWWK